MFIDHKGEKLAFRFKHNSETQVGENGEITPRGTICTVTKQIGTVEEFVAKSFARVHPKDNFDKKKGREISFGRALQEFVSKEDRLQFWQAYQNWRTSEPRMILGTKKERKAKLKVI